MNSAVTSGNSDAHEDQLRALQADRSSPLDTRFNRGVVLWLPLVLSAGCGSGSVKLSDTAPPADATPGEPGGPGGSADTSDSAGTDSATDSATDTATPPDTDEACPTYEGASDPRFDGLLSGLEAYFTGALPYDGLPSGASVALVVDGALRYAGGAGFQSKIGQGRSDRPVDADTRFWIASTSKWITAVGAMSLVDDGLLDPDAPVTGLLTDYTESYGRQDDITLHHLLRMKSGLGNDGGCYLMSVSASEWPDGCARFVSDFDTPLEGMFHPSTLAVPPYDGSLGVYNATLYGAPGAADWLYSNWGIMLAGRAMEVAAEREFSELIRERVFDPAAMCGAGFTGEAMTGSDNYALGAGASAIEGYCPEPELGHDCAQPWEPDEIACPGRNPNGGVRASAADLGRLAEVMLADLRGEERLLSLASARRMYCPGGGDPATGCEGRASTGAPTDWGDTYGYCNFLDTIEGYKVYSHGGGRAGYGAVFRIVPEADFAVVVLGNDEGVVGSLAPVADYAMRCFLEDDC